MKANIKTTVLVLLQVIFFFSSCAFFTRGDQLVYDFDAGYKQRRLVVHLPQGMVEESHDKDKNGILVRTFRYPDGSAFFIACHDLGANPVISLDTSRENMGYLSRIWGSSEAGSHDNGTSWRRQVRDGFVIGYDFVPPGSRESFDRAIHSVRITR